MIYQELAATIIITLIGMTAIIALICLTNWMKFKKLYLDCLSSYNYLTRELEAQKQAGKSLENIVRLRSGWPMPTSHQTAFVFTREDVNRMGAIADRMIDPDYYSRKYP